MSPRMVTNFPTQNVCATCTHVHRSEPAPRPWSEIPLPTYKCTLSGRRTSPCQTSCPLHKPMPGHVYPPPAHLNFQCPPTQVATEPARRRSSPVTTPRLT